MFLLDNFYWKLTKYLGGLIGSFSNISLGPRQLNIIYNYILNIIDKQAQAQDQDLRGKFGLYRVTIKE